MSIPTKKNVFVLLLSIFFCGEVTSAGSESMKSSTDSLAVGKNVIDLWAQSMDEAEKSIYIATYKLTSKTALKSLLEAKNRGVEIKLIFDEEEAISSKSLVGKAKTSGLNVSLWQTKNQGKLHAKLCIIDEKRVIFGSFNLTDSAEEENFELFYITEDQKVLEDAMNAWNIINSIVRKTGN